MKTHPSGTLSSQRTGKGAATLGALLVVRAVLVRAVLTVLAWSRGKTGDCRDTGERGVNHRTKEAEFGAERVNPLIRTGKGAAALGAFLVVRALLEGTPLTVVV